MKPRVPLDLSRVKRPAATRVLLARAPGADPLTGHRGEGGSALVAQAGPYTVIAHASRDAEGLVVRGQALAPHAAWLLGGMVHVRGEGSAVPCPLEPSGEFVARGWTGRLVALDLELEDGFWRIPWPSDRDPEGTDGPDGKGRP